MYGVSPTVKVLPPFDLSPYTDIERFVAGILWVELEADLESMEAVLRQKASGHTQCSSCFCDAKTAAGDLGEAFGSFRDLFEDFSMSTLEHTISSLASAATAAAHAMEACDLSAIIGKDITAELEHYALSLVPMLGTVEEAVEMAIEGENIYSDVSNAVLAWGQGQHFASGVNVAKLIHVVASLDDMHMAMAAAAKLAKASPDVVSQSGHVQMVRQPVNGQWVSCKAAKHPRHCLNIPVLSVPSPVAEPHLRGDE